MNRIIIYIKKLFPINSIFSFINVKGNSDSSEEISEALELQEIKIDNTKYLNILDI